MTPEPARDRLAPPFVGRPRDPRSFGVVLEPHHALGRVVKDQVYARVHGRNIRAACTGDERVFQAMGYD